MKKKIVKSENILNMPWRRIDYRINGLQSTIEGLKYSMNERYSQYKKVDWYNGDFLLEDTEPIIGLAFIACQNYINSSIFDKEESLKNKIDLYRKNSNVINDSDKTEIELVIALANYFKHRDDDKELHKGTRYVLESFDLNCDADIDVSESPIIKGIELLSDQWDFAKLVNIVREWREDLWNE